MSNFRGGGSADVLPIVLGALPIIAIVLPLLIDHWETDMIVIRIKKKQRLFYDHLVFSFLISMFFTIIIAISGLIGAFIVTGHIQNLWGSKTGTLYFLLENKSFFPLFIPHVTSLKVWAYLISSRFLAILFISVCVIFLKVLIKKNSLVFFITLILLGTDGLFTERFSLFLGRIRITMDTWLSPSEQWFNLIYLFLWIVVLSFLCLKFYENKEFIG
ncbi:hypothetical protein ACFO4N_14830 [Camelliibacillus cellulosilyticus]|uniref:ABC-2 type transport system permease protein n=1 Tax=Camelliibacillus cellulosilyticus TaxID=2174486 RepID=A0ABV9GRW3_9BACL